MAEHLQRPFQSQNIYDNDVLHAEYTRLRASFNPWNDGFEQPAITEVGHIHRHTHFFAFASTVRVSFLFLLLLPAPLPGVCWYRVVHRNMLAPLVWHSRKNKGQHVPCAPVFWYARIARD